MKNSTCCRNKLLTSLVDLIIPLVVARICCLHCYIALGQAFSSNSFMIFQRDTSRSQQSGFSCNYKGQAGIRMKKYRLNLISFICIECTLYWSIALCQFQCKIYISFARFSASKNSATLTAYLHEYTLLKWTKELWQRYWQIADQSSCVLALLKNSSVSVSFVLLLATRTSHLLQTAPPIKESKLKHQSKNMTHREKWGSEKTF